MCFIYFVLRCVLCVAKFQKVHLKKNKVKTKTETEKKHYKINY